MSMMPTSYVIYGYDLTSYVDEEKLSDWEWEDGKKYFSNQTPGNIQIFNDPASGDHIYLGYCIWYYEEFNDIGEVKISLSELDNKDDFSDILKELVDNKIIKDDLDLNLFEPQIICFTEWR